MTLVFGETPERIQLVNCANQVAWKETPDVKTSYRTIQLRSRRLTSPVNSSRKAASSPVSRRPPLTAWRRRLPSPSPSTIPSQCGCTAHKPPATTARAGWSTPSTRKSPLTTLGGCVHNNTCKQGTNNGPTAVDRSRETPSMRTRRKPKARRRARPLQMACLWAARECCMSKLA